MGHPENDFVKQLEESWSGQSDQVTATKKSKKKKRPARSGNENANKNPFELPQSELLARRKRLTVDVEEGLALWFRRFCAARGIKQRDIIEKLLSAFQDHHA